LDLIELRMGKPVHWWWLDDDVATMRQCLTTWAATCHGSARLAMVGCDEAALSLNPTVGDVELHRLVEVTDDQAAALAAAGVLRGEAWPWIDLRRDALAGADPYQTYRRPLAALAAAAVLLLAAVIAVALWRGREHAAWARELSHQQVEVFKSAFPHQSPPPSIKGRLQSEWQKLAGPGGPRAAGIEALAGSSALDHLRAVLAALPADLRLRILDLAVQPDLIRLDGQARSHAEAERIAAALRAAGLRDVEPPKTQVIGAGGVSFLLTARPPLPAAGAAAPTAASTSNASVQGGQ
jgi:hypothetical protein